MAKISTYADTPPPTLDDFLLGTDVNNNNATQNFLVSDLVNLIASPYKVFTALLTQSGTSVGDDQNNGTVLKGRTYQIIDNYNGDFSNVGAPDNNIGTYFIATSTAIPNSYGGAALAFNTGAPIANVLDNTIGNIWFTIVADGQYLIYKENNFDQTNTAIFIGPPTWDGGDFYFQSGPDGINPLILTSKFLPTGLNINGAFQNTPIEIRVYN
jgi:hypothetical protein